MIQYQIYPSILESHQAAEIAANGMAETEEDAAVLWFSEITEATLFEITEALPYYHRFKQHIPSIEADLYYDYGADYYFIGREVQMSEKEMAE